MEWKDISATESRLMDNDDIVAVLEKLPYPPFNWMLTFEGEYKEFENNSLGILKWKATKAVYNMCVNKMAYFKSTKELLPDIEQLAEQAGIYDEME